MDCGTDGAMARREFGYFGSQIAGQALGAELCRQIPRDSDRPMLPAPTRAALPLLLSISTPRPSWHPRSARVGGTLTMSGGGLSTSDPRIVGATLGRVTGARSAWQCGRPRRRCLVAAPSLPCQALNIRASVSRPRPLAPPTALARAGGPRPRPPGLRRRIPHHRVSRGLRRRYVERQVLYP